MSARSQDVLVKKFNIDSQLCMRVPSLNKDEAIGILLESISLEESGLGTEEKSFALMCANKCFFKEIGCDTGAFHPLALKAFGGHLNSKYGPTLSKWVAEIDDFDDVFAVLGKAFHDMDPKYRTVFMLLTIYTLPDMSTHKVTEWLAIICNEEMEYIEKAVNDLRKMAFIENFEPEIRIHELYIEFAHDKVKRMGRWLWWKGDESSTRGLISQDQAGFELVKLEHSMYRSPSQIATKYLKNLLVLQLVGVRNIRTLDFSRMDSLRSITLHYCKDLVAFSGMENLPYLAWLQIRGVNPVLKLPDLSSLRALQHLDIHIPVSHELGHIADLTPCVFLREIKVFYPSLVEFPRLNGLPYLEKVEFRMCCRVMKPLDCENCVMLGTVVLDGCCEMAGSPLLAGCRKLYKIVLSECNAVTTCPDVDAESSDGLENLQLWDMGELKEIPSFSSLSNLTVLKIGKCGIREPPDLTCCAMLEDVYFFTLKSLERFPNFSSLTKLKKLSLCNCINVQDPPDIMGCHQLQVFHLLYNDNMKGLSNMDLCKQLEEIKVSWHCKDQVIYQGIDPESCQGDDNLDSCLDYWEDVILENLNDIFFPVELKEWQRMQAKTMLVKKFFRGAKLYYFVTAPYESCKTLKGYSQNSITLRLVGNKVMAFPMGEGVTKHCDWLTKVRGYFAAKKFFARASAGCENVEGNSCFPRYRVPAMQGETRMCQAVAGFFNKVKQNEKGIRVAGLYGMSGQGKTTLVKAFCNVKLGDFGGRVCYLDFSRGNKLDRQKLVLKYLGDCRESQVEWVTNEDEAHYFFKTVVEGQKVLLVLDHMTQASIDERKYYSGVQLGEDSCILLTGPSEGFLKSLWNFNIDEQSCMHVPILTKDEAIAILIEGTSLKELPLRVEHRSFALNWANRCSYKNDRGSRTFHPLALKAYGRHFFSKQYHDRSTWVAAFEERNNNALDDVVAGLGKAFDDMDPKHRTIFRHLVLSRTTNTSSEVVKCLAQEMNLEIKYTNQAVEDLCKNGFIEEIEPRIRIHFLVNSFITQKNITAVETGLQR
ncbi:uncharacterized protein LOC131875444 [Cryptomeria japonica]|uniref:uncharacterized protein LOC131875444 n=1 Tax=Cryptomeria japonica TaxID=3369 RepID=UPI0027DA1459|nr:uncharacterized protein LOC131875444 [Cryptomeria japonica]